MKKFVNSYFIFRILVCKISFAQDNGTLKDGYQIFKYPNGAVSSEGLIKNGKPEGFWKSYYVTGIKKSEGKRTKFFYSTVSGYFMIRQETQLKK